MAPDRARPAERLSPGEATWRDAVLAAAPDLRVVQRVARAFRRLFETHDAAGRTRWLRHAAHGPLATFARGLRRDVGAVRAAITEGRNQG
jgi:transposase